jgi:hypothetical protein
MKPVVTSCEGRLLPLPYNAEQQPKPFGGRFDL